MKKLLILFYLCCTIDFSVNAQEAFIIDHSNTDLSEIPDNWIDSAQKNLNVRYYRRSHGSQIDLGGMTAIMNYSTDWAEKYKFLYYDEPGSLKLTTEYISLDYDSPLIYSNTREFLNDPANSSTNIVMFAWSYNFYVSDVQGYIDSVENLIEDYGPNGSYINNGMRSVPVTFIFQTACSHKDPDRNILIHQGNELIRQHCINNNRILYDFADIEAYNPDGEYFGDANPDGSYSGSNLLNDDISYNINETTRGNWGLEWIAENPVSELAQLSADEICTSCAHSNGGDGGDDNSRLHCVLKGRAAWWLFARLAGWIPESSSSELVISSHTNLTESNLNEAVINLSLTEETFLDNSFDNANFYLNNAPEGLSISSFSFTDNQHISITLAFDGTDFDSDIDNFNITVLESELSGSMNLTSNNLSISALSESLSIATDTDVNESNLNGTVINLSLTEETFLDNSFDNANFYLNNAPEGLSISSFSFTDNQHISITLAFDGTDFDSDIDNFNITVLESELSGSMNLTSNNLSISALSESLSIATDTDVNESNLNGTVINLSLTEETFLDNSFDNANFYLNNAPEGLSISSFSFTDNQHLSITLAFDGTDFDSDIDNFNITVLESELSGSMNLTSNNLSISALSEGLSIATDTDVNESNLNGTVINLSLTEETFLDSSFDNANFYLNNAPEGLSISSFSFTDNQHLSITLAFDGTDFDSDIDNFNITVLESELSGSMNLTSNNLSIFAFNEDLAQAMISSDYDLYESLLDGATIEINLINESFLLPFASENDDVFELYGAPDGLDIEYFDIISPYLAEVVLSFNGQDFDQDYSNFRIYINKMFINGDYDLYSNNLIVYSEIENVINDITKNQQILISPNPSTGRINVRIPYIASESYYLKVLDTSGDIVEIIPIHPISGSFNLNLSHLKAGIYYLIVYNNYKFVSIKTIII